MENPRSMYITINAGTVFKAIAITAFVAGVIYLRDVLLVVLTAVVIASSIEPIIRRLQKFGIARIISVICIYILIGVVLAGIFYLLLPSILNDLSDLLSILPKYFDSMNLWNPTDSSVVSNIAPAARTLSATSQFSLQDLVSNFSNAITSTSEGFLQTVSLVFGGILSFVMIIVISFYLAAQEDGVTKFLKIVVPLSYEKYVVDLWKRTQEKIGLWMQGQLVLGLIIGVLAYLGLTILGIKNALLLALLAAAFEIIPVFGPVLSAIPGILVGFSDGGISKALLVAGFYLIIQQFENHLIYPLVVKKIVGIPPILVILALIVGAKLAGFLGVLLSVPVATALVEYLNDFQKNKIAKVAASSSTS